MNKESRHLKYALQGDAVSIIQMATKAVDNCISLVDKGAAGVRGEAPVLQTLNCG